MLRYRVEHDGRAWAVSKAETPAPGMTAWKLLNCFNTRKDAVKWVQDTAGQEYEIDIPKQLEAKHEKPKFKTPL